MNKMNENKLLKTGQHNETCNSTDETTDTFQIGRDILEAFSNLQWNVVDKSQYEDCMRGFLQIKEDSPIQSHALKLINAELFCYPEEAYDLTRILSENTESGKYYVPGVKDDLIIYPQKSTFTRKEHYSLYYLLCRNKFKTPPLKERDVIEFQDLLKKASPEYADFQHFVNCMWIKQQCQRSLVIPTSVLEYMNKLWSMRTKPCTVLYPAMYKVKTQIPLMLNDPNYNYSVMELEKTISCSGTLPRMSLPSLKSRCELITDTQKLCQIKPISNAAEQSFVKPLIQPVPPVSIDPLVRKYASEENVDVVITCSGIKTIVDVYNVQRDWLLPVTVKNVASVNGDVKKVVIIDKCLPPSEMSVYDKNVWHAKLVSKWSLLLNSNPHLFHTEACNKQNSSSQKEELQKREQTKYDLDSTGVEVAEEFGVSVHSKSMTKLGKRKINTENKKKEELCDNIKPPIAVLGSDVEEGELLQDTMDDLPPSKQKLINNPVNSEDDLLCNECVNRPRYVRKNVPKTLKKPCVNYRLWKLQKAKHFNMCKQEQRCLKVLVRSQVDGNLVAFNQCERKVDTVYVSSKLEYQPEYGASRMSNSELVREYVDIFIRHVKLCRVRAVGHTKELMMFEVLSLPEFKEILNRHHIKTNKLFDPLYSVLTKLIDLPVGRYMLRHTHKMGAFVELMTEEELNCNFNLLHYCRRLNDRDVNLPAAQIDPLTLTRIHFRDKHPPALFLAASENNKNARFLNKKPSPNKETLQEKKRRQKRRKAALKNLKSGQQDIVIV